jgi:hypothetical protein
MGIGQSLIAVRLGIEKPLVLWQLHISTADHPQLQM